MELARGLDERFSAGLGNTPESDCDSDKEVLANAVCESSTPESPPQLLQDNAHRQFVLPRHQSANIHKYFNKASRVKKEVSKGTQCRTMDQWKQNNLEHAWS